jgi:hypothetical protein
MPNEPRSRSTFNQTWQSGLPADVDPTIRELYPEWRHWRIRLMVTGDDLTPSEIEAVGRIVAACESFAADLAAADTALADRGEDGTDG